MAKRKILGLAAALLALILISAVSLSAAFFVPDSVACMSRAESGFRPFGSFNLSRITSRTARLDGLRLYVGGIPFGIKFMTDGVVVVGFSDVECDGSVKNPASEAGLLPNDMIKMIDGKEIHSAAELTRIVEQSSGRALPIVYTREGKEYNSTLSPAYSGAEGKYKTGAYVRDSGAGIGTLTYIEPESLGFGGLGHGICDSSSGRLVDIYRGSVAHVTISGIVKGQVGTPGEVKGYFGSGKLGSLTKNTDCGVYGVLGELPEGVSAEPVEVASRGELKCGKAEILSTLDTNKVERYDVEISDIDLSSKGNKCFSIKVVDSDLLGKTGGIVQGMSGSPIIQNGKLVGAVTHVLINDPTSGYGIFIENMLSQMGDIAA